MEGIKTYQSCLEELRESIGIMPWYESVDFYTKV